MSRLSTAARCARLNLFLFVVLVVALAIVAVGGGGTNGFVAVLVAFGICAASANAALWLAMIGHGTPGVVSSALGGSMVGMVPPLAAGLILQQRGGPLAAAGVFGWIVVFYLTALVAKTLLIAPTTGALSPRPTSTNASSKAGA